MNDAKYIGTDVHTATISAAVRDSSGNLVMEATLETKAETIRAFCGFNFRLWSCTPLGVLRQNSATTEFHTCNMLHSLFGC
jgi:hypothetical protein